MHYIKNWEKQEDCNSSEVSKYVQLIFFRGLRRSVGAVRAPVDNHLLCGGGGGQGGLEQMALVLFCRGCFHWMRNAPLNARLCGRGEANWSPPARCSSWANGLLSCVSSNYRATDQFWSFVKPGRVQTVMTSHAYPPKPSIFSEAHVDPSGKLCLRHDFAGGGCHTNTINNNFGASQSCGKCFLIVSVMQWAYKPPTHPAV